MTTDEFVHKMNEISKDKIYKYQEFLDTHVSACKSKGAETVSAIKKRNGNN